MSILTWLESAEGPGAGQLVVFIKASFLLVFLWLILGAECAGDTLADGEEDLSVQRSTQRTAAWKGLRVFLSKANTMKLQYLGTGGHGGQTAEAPQISLEHSGTQPLLCARPYCFVALGSLLTLSKARSSL